MARFKILKGGSARLDSQAKTEGNALYTVDDGGFYIDAAKVNDSGNASTGSVIRQRVNDADVTTFTDSESIGASTVYEAICLTKRTLSYNSSSEKLTLSKATNMDPKLTLSTYSVPYTSGSSSTDIEVSCFGSGTITVSQQESYLPDCYSYDSSTRILTITNLILDAHVVVTLSASAPYAGASAIVTVASSTSDEDDPDFYREIPEEEWSEEALSFYEDLRNSIELGDPSGFISSFDVITEYPEFAECYPEEFLVVEFYDQLDVFSVTLEYLPDNVYVYIVASDFSVTEFWGPESIDVVDNTITFALPGDIPLDNEVFIVVYGV